MSDYHLQILAGLALLLVLAIAFLAIAARLNDRREEDRSELDIWDAK